MGTKEVGTVYKYVFLFVWSTNVVRTVHKCVFIFVWSINGQNIFRNIYKRRSLVLHTNMKTYICTQFCGGKTSLVLHTKRYKGICIDINKRFFL